MNESNTESKIPKPKYSSTPKQPPNKRLHECVSSDSSSDPLASMQTSQVGVEHLSEKTTISALNNKMDKILDILNDQSEKLKKLEKCDEIEEKMSMISHRVGLVEGKTSDHDEQIDSLKASVEIAHSDIAEIKSIKSNYKAELSNILETQHIIVKQANHVSAEINKIKAYSQRSNLIFEGIREEPGENCVQTISRVIANHLDLQNAHTVIDKAHRLGNRLHNTSAKPRPIIVRFTTHSAKETTYARRRRLGQSGIWVKEHLPFETERKQRMMTEVLKRAKHKDNNAYVKDTKLHYKGMVYDIDTVRKSDLNVEQLHQREDDNTLAFFGQFSPFYNLYNCDFTVNGTAFSCEKQCFMATRAQRHGDTDTLAKIMTETDPANIKNLSKFIKKRSDITIGEDTQADVETMTTALQAKFKLPELRQCLIKTGNKQLVEASKDKFWASGIPLRHDQCLDSSQYKGANKLGTLLQQIRREVLTTM